LLNEGGPACGANSGGKFLELVLEKPYEWQNVWGRGKRMAAQRKSGDKKRSINLRTGEVDRRKGREIQKIDPSSGRRGTMRTKQEQENDKKGKSFVSEGLCKKGGKHLRIRWSIN